MGFFSCHGLQQKTGIWNSGSVLAEPEFAAEQLHLGCLCAGQGPWGNPFCYWFTHQKLSKIEAESTWRLVNHESASAKSDSQKIIILFPHSFAKMTHITGVIKNKIFFSICFFCFLLLKTSGQLTHQSSIFMSYFPPITKLNYFLKEN